MIVFPNKSRVPAIADSATVDRKPERVLYRIPNLMFIFLVLLDFLYWVLNAKSAFLLNGISLTYWSYALLFALTISSLNKNLLIIYLIYAACAIVIFGALDSFVSITILFFVIQLAIKLRHIEMDEKFVSLLLLIIIIEMLLIFRFGQVNSNALSGADLFMGLSGSYKLLVYSLNVPLFVLGLCMVHTKSIFKKLITFVLFFLVFHMIIESHARIGLLYVFLWILFLSATLSRSSKFILVILILPVLYSVYLSIGSNVIGFWLEKGFSGRDQIFASGLQNILSGPLRFIFGLPGAASDSAFYSNLLVPDLGSLYVSLHDYGIIGLCIFAFLIFKFFCNFAKHYEKSYLPIIITGGIAIFDPSASNFFAFSTPSVVILWAVLINNRYFVDPSFAEINSIRERRK